MRQIRFKVKHLLSVCAILLVFFALGYLLLPSLLFSQGEKYRAQGEPLTAKIYYDRLNDYFPQHGKTAAALEQAAIIASEGNLLMVTPRSIGGTGGHPDAIISQEAVDYYTLLVERFPDTWHGKRAKDVLTLHYLRQRVLEGDLIAAKALLADGLETQTGRDFDFVWVAANALMVREYYTEALALIEEYIDQNGGEDNSPLMLELLGDIQRAAGQQDEALQYYQRAIVWNEKERERAKEENLEPTEYHDEKIAAITQKLALTADNADKSGTVTGTVTLAGRPLQGVELILQPLFNPHEYPISGSYTGLRVASDQQGHFSFKNLVPGRYGLGFVINLDEVGDVVLKGGRFPQSVFFVDAGEVATWDFELVETVDITAPVDDEVIKGDSITFAWEPVEGASYYRLELGTYIGGGSRSYSRGEKYRTNSATIGVDTLQSYHVGLSYDEKGPSPGSLLGYGMRGRYFWGVTAYDEAGAIITSSQGYLQAQNSDFQFPEEKTVAGDELLLERKYGQAITAYQEQLDKDDNDIHALTMLARLHSVTIDSQIYDYQYTDYAQAITYYNQLFTQTGNTEFLHSLTQIYFYNLKEYPLALETLQKIEERDVLNEWNQLQMAQIQSHLGQYQTALQTVIAAERRFFTEEAALRIITGDFSSIAEKAKSNKEEKWLDAMQVVARGYGKLDQELLQVVRNLPALEAIEYLETKERTREEELLLLSLLAVEPSTLVRAQEQLEDYAAMNIEQSPAWVTSVRILLQTIQ